MYIVYVYYIYQYVCMLTVQSQLGVEPLQCLSISYVDLVLRDRKESETADWRIAWTANHSNIVK